MISKSCDGVVACTTVEVQEGGGAGGGVNCPSFVPKETSRGAARTVLGVH